MKVSSEILQLGYRFLPDNLNEKLFGAPNPNISRLEKSRILGQFERFGLSLEPQENRTINFPDLDKIMEGLSLEGLLDKALEPYKDILDEVKQFLSHEDVNPPSIAQIRSNLSSGWIRYGHDGNIQPVEWPLERVMVLDVETYVRAGNYPVMAVSYTDQAYYLWVHKALVSDEVFSPELIDIGPDKIVLNYNVLFDANKTKRAYNLLKKDTIFIDIMSMHIASNGASREQKGILSMKGNKNFALSWSKYTTEKNRLIDAYNLHCPHYEALEEGDKSIRDLFITGDLQTFTNNILDLSKYTLLDGLYTFRLAKNLLPKYLLHNPHLVTFAGHIELGHTLLPVVSDWKQWVDRVNLKYRETKLTLDKELTQLAHELLAEGNTDYWSNQLDWTPAKTGKNKGVPAWYRKDILSKLSKKGQNPVSTSSNLAPILLKMEWAGNPLYYHKKFKWCYRVTEETPNSFYDTDSDQYLKKIPHPKGDRNNCGNPLSKDYVKYMDNDTMSSSDPRALGFMQSAKSLSYWTSIHSRVEEFYTYPAQDVEGVQCIKPYLIPHGTITRRAVESTWLTCSDIKPAVIGSELKSRVQAPEGYKLLGADFDAQELKYGSSLGDSLMGYHGSTPMSLTQMLGDKDKKTDGHSTLASFLSVDRQLAKSLNFLMLFFGGQKGLFESIKTNRMDLEDSEANTIARKALQLRRGTKDRQTGLFRGGTDSQAYNYMIGNAQSKHNRTVISKSAISRALWADVVKGEFMPSRCNRVIQSGGVDLLHVFATLLKYFIKKYEIDAYFLISIHDEIWTLVKEEHIEILSEVFQLCHLLAWCLFFKELGLESIPFDYLFFSSLNIDTVLRKEVDYSSVYVDGKKIYNGLKTPSNPYDEVPEGYNIKPKDMVWKYLG
jgi:DNA polymerase gamma 1